jgi:cytochrome P450
MSGRAVLGRPLPDQLATDIAAVEKHLLFGRVAGPEHFSDPTYQAHKDSLVTQLVEIVEERSWQAGTAETVLESLVNRDDGTVAPTEDVVTDLFLLLAAGSETTSAAIAWGLLFLAADQEWSERLRRDLAGWKPSDGIDIREHSLLAATVLETERLRPPLPLQFKVAALDLTFGDTVIPAGTRVLHAASVTHYQSEIFADPQRWKPERFLGGSRHLPPRCLGKFGGTSHICVGLPLARLEQMAALAVVSTGWDVLIDPPWSLTARMAPVLVPSEPIPARFSPR